MILIKFKNREDMVNGYYLLSLKGSIRSLPNDLFEVNNFMLKFLEDENIQFEVVERDVLSEIEKIRNTPAIVL
jgi:hypothetical protein